VPAFAKSSLPEFGLSMEMRHLAQSEFWQAAAFSLDGAWPANGADLDLAVSEALIGQLLWVEGKPQAGRALHVAHRDVLVAVLDANSLAVHLRTDMPPLDAQELRVSSRPLRSGGAPYGFRTTDAWSLAWRFGQLIDAAQDLVPPEFAVEPLALRRLPAVEVGLVEPRHMLIFRAMASGPKTMAQLAHSLGLSADVIKRDITSFFLVRAIRLS
jgi:hypothetical protein